MTQERPALRLRSEGKQYQKQYQRGTQGSARRCRSTRDPAARWRGRCQLRAPPVHLGPFGLEEEQDQEGK